MVGHLLLIGGWDFIFVSSSHYVFEADHKDSGCSVRPSFHWGRGAHFQGGGMKFVVYENNLI